MGTVAMESLYGPAVYGFSVFIGVVAGAFVQFGLSVLNRRREEKLAKRLLAVEVEINKRELDRLEDMLLSVKDSIVAGQAGDSDYYLDMGRFVYRIVDPLINNGHFNKMMGPEGVQAYFRFANDLNASSARFIGEKGVAEHREGRGLHFIRWLIDTRMPEWRSHLDLIGSKVGVPFEAR